MNAAAFVVGKVAKLERTIEAIESGEYRLTTLGPSCPIEKTSECVLADIRDELMAISRRVLSACRRGDA